MVLISRVFSMCQVHDSYPWIYLPSWMKSTECFYWQKIIHQNVDWEKPFVKVFGSSYPIPRQTAFLAPKDVSYRYSSVLHAGKGWPNWFKPLVHKINTSLNLRLNGCLLNFYSDGGDRMGWHADNESELDSGQPIVSLSFGATRDFVLKRRNSVIKQVIPIRNGDLLIMKPPCQEEWLHSLPSRKKVTKSRLNLTFRRYKK